MPSLRRNRHAVPALCAVLWLLCAPAAQAAASLAGSLNDRSQTVELTPQAAFAPGSVPASTVLSGGAAFSPKNPVSAPALSNVWIRVPLRMEKGAAGPWVISMPRTVTGGEAYVPEPNGYRTLLVGSGVPYNRHAESYVLVGITIDRTAASSGKPLYLHLTYHADAPLWVRADTLRNKMSASFLYRLIDGLFFGILLAVGLCNLYVALAVRDRSAAWFVGYVGALVANELVMTGLGSAYLWPGIGFDARWPSVATELLAFGTFLGFTRTFLQTRTAAPLWDRLLIAAFVAVAFSEVARHALSGGERFAAAVLLVQFASMIVTIGAGIVRMRAGYHPARFFVAAFVPALAGIMASLAYNVFSPAGNWFFAENGVEFGAMAQCVILSFSLLDRIRILDVERSKTEAELLRTARRNVELKTLATRDPLTGIDNRLAFFEKFEDEIEYARRSGLLLGVLYIDLDEFKAVNDRYGHRVGDVLLQIFSRRLKNAVRPSDTVARLGGDEFAVLVTGVSDAAVLDAVQANVVRILDTHIMVEGALVTVGMSVGAAIFPRDGEEADALMEAADHRMYHAKQGGAEHPAEGNLHAPTPRHSR
jgi:diguanylate cyclase (GGDEF)-like protein